MHYTINYKPQPKPPVESITITLDIHQLNYLIGSLMEREGLTWNWTDSKLPKWIEAHSSDTLTHLLKIQKEIEQ